MSVLPPDPPDVRASLDGHPKAIAAALATLRHGHGLGESEVEALINELEGLRQRLQSLPVIEQAKGLLMGHYGLDAQGAFGLLQRWSMHHNIKLRDLSTQLVDAVTDGSAPIDAVGVPAQVGARQRLGAVIDRLNRA